MKEPDSISPCHSAKKHKKKEKKHKKEKKEKKHKHKHKQSPPRSEEHKTEEECQGSSVALAETFGPALPPHLRSKCESAEQSQVIGPVLPEGITLNPNSNETSDSDEEEVFGPLPANDASLQSMTTAQIALEQRALEMKLAKLNPESNPVDTNVREEWMLELPDVGLKSGLSSLKRTFHTKERPDFSDRSSWTKTPNSNEAPSTSKVTETTKSIAEQQFQAVRDAEQEKIAKKLKKKHKRDESLYEMHQKKLKKEKKEKEANGKTERRPFSRDVDLQLNKIDKNQTKTIVDKAKFLDSRFSSGNTKYL